MTTSAKDRKVIFYMYLGVALAIPFLIVTLFVHDRYFMHPVRHIKSLAYIAPKGCIVKRYQTLDAISPACAAPAYVIPHNTAMSYDWLVGRARVDYYRVGDDAYQIDCAVSHPDVCRVSLYQYDAFAR